MKKVCLPTSSIHCPYFC